jgi:hypothetical protein
MNGFKLSARVPFVSTAAGNSQLVATGDWSFLPGSSSNGMLVWNSGRNAASIQLFFAPVPPGKWKCDISCHIGNGQVMLMAGSGINFQPGGNDDRVISTNEFTVDNSGVAFVNVISMGNLDHFSFYSATLEAAQ